MRRYLDIIREMQSNKKPHPPVVTVTNGGARKNEINEKRGVPMHPGMWVRWNRTRTGRIVLVSGDGWVVVREYVCGERLVFLRVDGDVRIGRDAALC
jgi:hypothetical protein